MLFLEVMHQFVSCVDFLVLAFELLQECCCAGLGILLNQFDGCFHCIYSQINLRLKVLLLGRKLGLDRSFANAQSLFDVVGQSLEIRLIIDEFEAHVAKLFLEL